MQPRKLSVFFSFYPYSGVGASSATHPDVMHWFARTCLWCAREGKDRIEKITSEDFADTPITMTRNRACEIALNLGYDILVMVDSDMAPDLYSGKLSDAKLFFQSSFDYLYDHYEKGPVMIGAPYCGPPPHPIRGGDTPVYIFQWVNDDNVWHVTKEGEIGCADHNQKGLQLVMYSRAEASRMAGIQPCAALPTGLIMIDTRLLKILPQPYFDYEWKSDGPPCKTCGVTFPGRRSHKASTEDVVHTRDASLVGQHKLGYNPVLCNWDAWAGHWKPCCVGKPYMPTVEGVNRRLRESYERGFHTDERQVCLGDGNAVPDDLPDDVKRLMDPRVPLPTNGAPLPATPEVM